MPKIAIIGGGMAGLAAATKLTQQGKQVILFEAGPSGYLAFFASLR